MPESIFVTVKEAAKLLHLSESVVYDLCRTNYFPVVRVGRKVLIHREKMEAWACSKVGEAIHV